MLFERIKELCDMNGITPERLGEIIGVSVSSIRKWQTTVPSVEKVAAVATYFHVSIDYLMGLTDIPVMTEALVEDRGLLDLILDDRSYNISSTHCFSSESLKIARRWSALDECGRYTVDAVIGAEETRMASAIKPERETRIIPLIGNSFAAGIGEPDFGNALEEYEIDLGETADFAVRVNGKSMEPYFHDGQIVLGIKGSPKIGDIVAIMVDGAFYIKQFVVDNYGNLYLLSLNRDYPDVEVKHSAGSTVCCFGIIKTKKRIPLAR